MFLFLSQSDPKFGTFDDEPMEEEKIIADLVDITHFFVSSKVDVNPDIIEARGAEFFDSDFYDEKSNSLNLMSQ